MAAVSETTTTVAWTIEAGDAGTRIDAFLAAQLPWRSRRSLVGLLDDGAATVEGRRVKKSHRLAVGQRVELTVPAAAVPTEAIAAIELPILFEDDDLVVVNKPSGLAVHPAVTCPHVHVLARLAHRYTVEAPSPNTEAAVVHRLDRETSGALALARRREQVAFYAAQFERRTVRKRYVAVVRGEPPERGEIVHALAVVDGEPVRVAMASRRAPSFPCSSARPGMRWSRSICTPVASIRSGCTSPPKDGRWSTMGSTGARIATPGPRMPASCSTPRACSSSTGPRVR